MLRGSLYVGTAFNDVNNRQVQEVGTGSDTVANGVSVISTLLTMNLGHNLELGSCP